MKSDFTTLKYIKFIQMNVLKGIGMHYLFEVFIGNLTIFYLLESFLFGICIATSIYFFSKNKWRSILLCVPFSVVYLFVVRYYSFHLYFVIFELLIQYILITVIETYQDRQKNFIKRLFPTKKEGCPKIKFTEFGNSPLLLC